MQCHAANATAAFVCDQTDLGNTTVEEAAMQAAEDISVTAATLIARLNVNCFACAPPPCMLAHGLKFPAALHCMPRGIVTLFISPATGHLHREGMLAGIGRAARRSQHRAPSLLCACGVTDVGHMSVCA